MALDLRGVRPGPAVFRIVGEALDLPRGVDVVRLTPSEVTLEFAAVVRKTRAGARRLHRQAAERPARHRHAGGAGVGRGGRPGRARSRQIKAAETAPIDLAEAPRRADRARPGRSRRRASTSPTAPRWCTRRCGSRSRSARARWPTCRWWCATATTAPRSTPADGADHRARAALGDRVA